MSGLDSQVELILFDAVGTLIYPDPPVIDVYHQVGQKFGSQLTHEQIRQRFASALQFSYQARSMEGCGKTCGPQEHARWQMIVREVFAEADELAAELIFNELWQHFAKPASWRLFDDVAPAIQALQQRGYRLGIASNFDERLLNICRNLPPLDALNPVFVSSLVGWSKPAREFYRQVELAAHLKPAQIMLVGDDYENDVATPRKLGWQARWIGRIAESATGGIRSLGELCDQLI